MSSVELGLSTEKCLLLLSPVLHKTGRIGLLQHEELLPEFSRISAEITNRDV